MDKKNMAILCEKDNSALLIIDLQTSLTAIMPAKVLARLQRNIGLLIKSAAILDIPVFSTEQYPQGLGRTEEEISKILPDYTKKYEKTSFSCSGAENFMDDLKSTSAKQVILAGMEAHICIQQSAMDLVNEGYEVFVVADAVCSRHRESYETSLQRMKHAGVVICDAESIIFEWLGDAKNEHFKTIQSLIVRK